MRRLSPPSLYRRLASRTGARLALIQAVIVVIAFGLAGLLTHLSIQRLNEAATRDRISQEVASMNDEFAQRGAAHLPHTVAKRTRLWRGFDYRLANAQGKVSAGLLPAAPGGPGWAKVRARDGLSAALRRYLVFTERLPDGSVLSIGQALALGDAQMTAVNRALMASGLLGVLFCVGVSYLFNRQAWRRIAAVAATAQEVTAGRLDVRTPVAAGAPRDDVDEMAQAFNAMLDRIGTLVGQVRQVSTDIAHDLRTPLTRFRQKLERLSNDFAHDPAMLGAVRALDADVGDILRTFDALLQLSEIESVGEGRQTKPVPLNDLADIVGRVVGAFRPDIEDSGRILDFQGRAAPVGGDVGLLAQAAANLLENAFRHTAAGARIVVEVEACDGVARLSVTDDGPGIPALQREAVLKPFVRLEPSRRMPGSGLGLSIVAAIAARHGAALRLEDAAPGLRVVMMFPPISPQQRSGATQRRPARARAYTSGL